MSSFLQMILTQPVRLYVFKVSNKKRLSLTIGPHIVRKKILKVTNRQLSMSISESLRKDRTLSLALSKVALHIHAYTIHKDLAVYFKFTLIQMTLNKHA